MDRFVDIDADGAATLHDGEGGSLSLGVVTPDQLTVAAAAFFGPDLSMPDEVPMHAVRMFLIATNRKQQVIDFLKSLAEPNRSMALEEFEYAPNFVPDSAMGRATQAALGLTDADYAEAVRNMAAHTIDDYGSPKPTFLATIAKFFKGS